MTRAVEGTLEVSRGEIALLLFVTRDWVVAEFVGRLAGQFDGSWIVKVVSSTNDKLRPGDHLWLTTDENPLGYYGNYTPLRRRRADWVGLEWGYRVDTVNVPELDGPVTVVGLEREDDDIFRYGPFIKSNPHPTEASS